MKLTEEQKGYLRGLGQRMLVSTQQYKLDGFTFEAAVKALQAYTEIMQELLDFMKPYVNKAENIGVELSHTSSLNFIKKYKLKHEIKNLDKLVRTMSSTTFSADTRDQLAHIFNGAPVQSIYIHENHKECQRSNGFGLFERAVTEEHVYNYTVTFADGTELVWHTLHAGEEFNRIRDAYNKYIPSTVGYASPDLVM